MFITLACYPNNNLKSYFENHPWWWAGIFLSLGATATFAGTKFLYLDPQDRYIATLQKQLDEAKSSPELQSLKGEIQQLQSNRNEWINHAKNLESKVSSCNNNALVVAEISKLTQAKKNADDWVDFFLSPKMNSGNEPSKANILRADEYRRQATQLQERILSLQAKISF